MMRNPAVLIVVLITLIGLIALVVRPGGEGEEETSSAALFAGLDSAEVDAISVRDGENRTQLKRGPSGWVIASDNDFPADREGVNRLLRETIGLSMNDVASRKAEKHVRFEVDSASATEVRLDVQDNTVARFFVGKEGPDMSSQYVRAAGREEVFLQAGRLRDAYTRQHATWRNKTVLEVESDEVHTIELLRGEERLVFESDLEGNWTVAEPMGFDPVEPLVIAMARVMTRLTASGFPDEDEKGNEGFDAPGVVINATLFNGTAFSLEIGRERDDQPGWFVRKGGEDIVYVVPSSRLNNFIRPAEELMKPAAVDTAESDSALSGGE